MARLRKPELLNVVERALRDDGFNILHLSQPGTHPGRYQVFRGDQTYRLCVYIWNLTHGGRNRPVDEWRIQVTGIDSFQPEPGGKTLILGWWDDTSVFAGFDLSRHTGNFGASPSIQLQEAALHQAVINGFAPHNKGNGELAIAFRPDFLPTYIENLELLHGCGEVSREIELLHQIGQDPASLTDTEITEDIAEPRRYAFVSTRKALRDIDFRDRVLTAYSQRCAMCGIQLRLLDGAHILPVAHPDSTDGTDNGVALCTLHHRAFDRSLLTFDPEYRILLNEEMLEELKSIDQARGYKKFKKVLRPILALPPDKKDRPAAHFIEAANELRGWAV